MEHNPEWLWLLGSQGPGCWQLLEEPEEAGNLTPTAAGSCEEMELAQGSPAGLSREETELSWAHATYQLPGSLQS